MANVITCGTFDSFHVGHLRLLQRARSVVRKELLYHGVLYSRKRLHYHELRSHCVPLNLPVNKSTYI